MSHESFGIPRLVTVLVVDDEESNRYYFSNLLKKSGYRVLEASTAKEILAVPAHEIDLIILDVNLPDMSGFEVSNFLKRDPRFQHIPIIQTSASFTHGSDYMRGIDSGADAYVSAPVDPLILLSTVKAWLRVSSAEREREVLQKKIQADFAETHENLFEFFMQSPQPMVILEGPEHRFKLVNPPYEKLIGKKVSGKRVRDVFSEEEIRHFVPLLDGVLHTGNSFVGKEVAFNVLDDSGTQRHLWIDIGYHLFRDVSHQIKGVMAIVNDVTAQVEMRVQLEKNITDLAMERVKLEEMIASSTTGIALLKGESMVFEKVNTEFESLVSPRSYLGRKWEDVYSELSGSELPSYLRHVFYSGAPFKASDFKVLVEKKTKGSPEPRYYNFDYVRTLDSQGQPYGVMIQCTDVTARYLARAELQRIVSELKLERDLRERFVAALTHDLRTPLTAAKINAQILAKAETDQRIGKITHRIVQNMDRADNMIRDLLDASRIKAGEKISVEITECDLRDLVEGTVENLASIHGDRFIIEGVQSSVLCYWDCSAIRRTLENLVNNAVKYGASITPIRIRLGVGKDQVRISIHNEGNPIEGSELQQIFEPYKRSNSADSGVQKGWGIGLTLVKGLAEAHGGLVSVVSSRDAGTSFTIELPQDSRKHLTAKT